MSHPVNKYKQLEKNDEGKFVEREEQSLNALPENFISWYHFFYVSEPGRLISM